MMRRCVLGTSFVSSFSQVVEQTGKKREMSRMMQNDSNGSPWTLDCSGPENTMMGESSPRSRRH